MFYHIRVTPKSRRTRDEVEIGLSEEDLILRFVTPYEKGDPIVIQGATVPMNDLERIRISRSIEDPQQLISQVEISNRSSGVLVIGGPSDEWQAASRAEDVTSLYIKSPPGYKQRAPTDEFDNLSNEAKAALVYSLGFGTQKECAHQFRTSPSS